MKWSVVLVAIGCSAQPAAPQTVVVERIVYVEREAPEPVERVEPTEPIGASPLLDTHFARQEELRGERAARQAAREAPAVVYEPVPVPVYVERSEPRRLSSIERRQLDRDLDRCERRGSQWARERCEERARAR
jgi:hypothetical protein